MLGTLLSSVIAFVLGIVGGVVITPYFKPLTERLERRSRRRWDVPIYVHCESDQNLMWSGLPDWISHTVYVAEGERLPEHIPRARSAWFDAVRRAGGVDVYVTPLKITIQAKAAVAVVIDGVRVSDHVQKPLTDGVVVTRGVGGADLTPRRINIVLDDGPEPLVNWMNEASSRPSESPAFKLATGDAERFHIWVNVRADAEATRHEWRIVLDLIVEGKKMAWSIPEGGSRFVTVSPGNLPYSELLT